LSASIFTLDPTISTAAFAGLELALQKALQFDIATRQKIHQLDGQVFAFDCTDPVFRVYFFADSLSFRQIYDGAVTAQLSGSGKAFLALARANDAAAELINNPELRLIGNSRALVTLQEIIAQVDIDWEMPLTQLFGDIIGHQLAETFRVIHNQVRYSANSLHRQIGEFLREESGWLPAREEIDDFLRGVDDASMRVDRASATLNWLRQKITARGNSL
jgi:ubiquinone biosynthesis protein UbiJ